MKVLSVDKIRRRESPLLYRTAYDAVATLATEDDGSVETPFEFVIETDPFGKKAVTVKVSEDNVDTTNAGSAETLQDSLVAKIEDLRNQGALP
jgi:hypothetical protein